MGVGREGLRGDGAAAAGESDKRGYVDPASPEAVPGRARRRVTFQSFGCGSEARAGGLAVIIA